MGKILKKCDICGTETTNNKFCSKKCYGYSQSKVVNGQRVCGDCRELKPLEEFPSHGKGRKYWYCYVCHRKKMLAISHTIHDRFMRSKRRAEKKLNVEWSLSEDRYGELVKLPCHYCGGPLGISGVGLDRKENNVGYTNDNALPCCKRCNVVKNDYFSYDEMMLLSPVLFAIREKRNIIEENLQ